MMRLAKSKDVVTLARLDKQCNPSAWSEAQFLATIHDPHNVIYILEKDDIAIGFIVWQHILDEIELHLIAIMPAWRRQGNALLLLNSMFMYAKQYNVKRIFLEVRAHNVGAQALYKYCEFVEIARRKAYYTDNNEDAILMEKLC